MQSERRAASRSSTGKPLAQSIPLGPNRCGGRGRRGHEVVFLRGTRRSNVVHVHEARGVESLQRVVVRTEWRAASSRGGKRARMTVDAIAVEECRAEGGVVECGALGASGAARRAVRGVSGMGAGIDCAAERTRKRTPSQAPRNTKLHSRWKIPDRDTGRDLASAGRGHNATSCRGGQRSPPSTLLASLECAGQLVFRSPFCGSRAWRLAEA